MRMRKRLPRMLLSLIAAAVVLPTARAAQFGAIVGMVRDAAAVPVAQATVTALRVDGSGTRATLSGSDGVYSFADLAPGTWSVTAELDGYPQATTPSLVVVAGKATRHDIALNARAAPAAPAAGSVPGAAPTAAPSVAAAVAKVLPEALQPPEPGPAVDTQTPFAVGDIAG